MTFMASRRTGTVHSAGSFSALSFNKLIHDQVRTAMWYRLYQLTGVWRGMSRAGEAERWLSLNVSQLFMALAPWSILAFPAHYHFFVAMESVLDAMTTRVLVMNSLQANSIQDLLHATIYTRSSMLSTLPPAHAALIGTVILDAHNSARCSREDTTLPSQSIYSQAMNATCASFSSASGNHDLKQRQSSVQKLLSWSDACFGVDQNMTLHLEDCSVYTSPGGFSLAGGTSLLSDEALVLAMDITERIASLSDAPGPLPTDMPLLFINLTQQALSDLHSWLHASYDWQGDITRLLAPNLSAELLAWDIMGFPMQVAPVPDSAPVIVRDIQRSSTAAVPRRRHLTPKTDLSIVVYPNDELSSIEVVPAPYKRNKRLVPKADISIVVYPPAEFAEIEIEDVSPPMAPPAYVSVATTPSTPSKYLKGEVELDIGMASYSTWNGGRKASILAGLLAIGSMLSPSPRSPIGPLLSPMKDVRSPPQARPSSILSPWLDVVHIHGLDPIQSPWIADHSEANTASLFPESPFGF